LPLITQIAFYYLFGYYGVGIGLFISNLAILIFLKYQFKIEFKFKSNAIREALFLGKDLYSKGYILFITSLLSFFAINGDRFFIERFWSIHLVGQFSAVLLFPSLINIFSTNFTELIINKIIKNKSIKYTIVNIFILLSIVSIVLIVSFLLLPFILQNYLTKYIELIDQIKLSLFLSLFISIVPLIEYYFHSIDKRKYILITQIISITIYLFSLFFVLNNYNSNIYYLLILKFGYYIITIIIFSFFLLRLNKKSA
jgi:O-antigen/teichoic acid export membrane protein